MNYEKFLRTPFFIEHPRWMLLKPVFRSVIKPKDNFLFLFFESLDFKKSPTATFAQATRICHLDIKDSLF